MFNKSFSPPVEVVETLLASDVVNECATVSSSVESVSEGLELLLAGGVPNLQSYDRVVYHQLLLGKICTNCWL
jgi:hypothetical protein